MKTLIRKFYRGLYKEALLCDPSLQEGLTINKKEFNHKQHTRFLTFDKDYYQKAEQRWKLAIIIKFQGRKFTKSFLFYKIQSLWKPQGILHLITLNCDHEDLG